MPLHKSLHIVLPVIILLVTSLLTKEQIRVLQISVLLFIFGLIKEICDGVYYHDPVSVFLWDLGANSIGIGLGIALGTLVKSPLLRKISSE